MAGSLIGIDVGNDSCKLAVRDGGQICFISGQLPDNLVTDGEIVSLQTLGEFIQGLRRENSVSGRDCSIVLEEGVLTLTLSGTSLSTVGDLATHLGQQDMVESVSVSTASNNANSGSGDVATLTMKLTNGAASTIASSNANAATGSSSAATSSSSATGK